MPRGTARERLAILVRDDDDRTILVGEVKRGVGHDRSDVKEQIQRHVAQVHAAFGILADAESILIAPAQEGNLAWDRAMRLSTHDVLGPYSGGDDLSRAEGFYLTTLVEAWLRDFAFAWRSQTPPGSAELAGIGLSDRLRGADVVADVGG